MRFKHPASRTLFISRAIEHPGALHRQLGVPESEALPRTFLEAIRATPVGRTARNPTQVGRKSIKVTATLKRRAVLALNLDHFNARRHGHSVSPGGTEK